MDGRLSVTLPTTTKDEKEWPFQNWLQKLQKKNHCCKAPNTMSALEMNCFK